MSEARRDADDLLTFESTPMVREGEVALTTVGTAEALAPLFAKLVQVQRSIKKIKPTGVYDQGKTKYEYATEADVIEPISQALSKAGLAAIPSIDAVWWHDMPSKYNINRVVTARVKVMIGDSETGGFIIATTYSTAANADKATNAAFTTAVKYFMAKLAGVAFGDDADEYSASGEKAGKSTKPKDASKAEKDRLTKKIKELDAGDHVKAWMKENKVSFTKLTDVQAKQIDVVLDAFEALAEEPTDTGSK